MAAPCGPLAGTLHGIRARPGGSAPGSLKRRYRAPRGARRSSVLPHSAVDTGHTTRAVGARRHGPPAGLALFGISPSTRVGLGWNLWGRPPRRFAGEFGTGADAQLAGDVLKVCLDGRSAHEEAFADLGVCEPLGDECDDLVLCRGEAGPAVVGPLPLASSAACVGGGFAPVERASLDAGSIGIDAERFEGSRQGTFDGAVLAGKSPSVAGLVAE